MIASTRTERSGMRPAGLVDDLLPSEESSARRAWSMLVLAVGLVGCGASWLLASRDGHDFAYVGAMLTALVASVIGASGRTKATRTAWLFAAVAVGFLTAERLLDPAGTQGELAGPHDLAALSGIAADIALCLTVILVVRTDHPLRNRVSYFDVLTVAVALLPLWWPLVVMPVASSSADSPLALQATRAVATLLLGVAAVMLAPMVLRRTGVALLATGVSAELISRVSMQTHEPIRDAAPRVIGTSGSLCVAVLCALAVSRASDRRSDALDAAHVQRRRLMLMSGVVGVGPAALLGAIAISGELRGGVLVAGTCTIIAFMLITTRLARLITIEREAAVDRGARRFAALVQNSQDAFCVVDRAGLIAYASPALVRLTGIEVHALRGIALASLFPAQEAVRLREHLDHTKGLRPGESADLIGNFVDRFGEPAEFEMTSVNLLQSVDVGGVLVTIRDVTQRRQLERELTRKALHDELTGLANRALFLDRLEHALARSRRSAANVAVLFLDLDDFKAVNDGLGHSAGDALLIAVAERLDRCTRPGDTVARFGGDEFAVLLEDAGQPNDVVRAAEGLVESLQLPVTVEHMDVTVPASIGIAIASNVGDPEGILRDADIALYQAKAGGKARIAKFDTWMRWAAYERLHMRTELSRAVEANALRLMFQPIVALDTGEIRGAEALVRWEHPQFGMISPADFIPLAEESSLILSIGQWVMERACDAAAEWSRIANREMYVSVNVAVRQLREPAFAEVVDAALRESGLPAHQLMIELTESALIDDVAASNLVDSVVPLGVAVALDDFGTGYSSLSYLQRFPINAIKIDRSFVSDIENDGTRTVVEGITAISRVMGFISIAEGVETDEQLAMLEALDCTYAQGYWYSKPVDAHTLVQLLQDGSSWPSPRVACAESGSRSD